MGANQLRIEYVKASTLKEYAGNAKIHTEKQIEQIKRSIEEFGMNDPIAIWKNNEIIEGHGRLRACKELGIGIVPVIRLDDLSDEQRRAYMNVHNQLTMNTGFDFETLRGELESIEDIDMTQFGFNIGDGSWFETRERNEGKQEGNEEYNEFLEKFEPKKTTDDCYTPDEIYEVVARYVEKTYGVKRSNFVRPFYPNGDFEKENYKAGAVVVDNPPFSIMTHIVEWYTEHGIKFFLFCSGLTGFSSKMVELATVICTGASVTYENGANVNTSFVTNLESETVARTDPELRYEIDGTDARIHNDGRAELPRYKYPPSVVTSAMMGTWSGLGVKFSIKRGHAFRVSGLDAQDERGIYGGGLLLSEQATKDAEQATKDAERREREQKPTIYWELSEREKQISASLGK